MAFWQYEKLPLQQVDEDGPETSECPTCQYDIKSGRLTSTWERLLFVICVLLTIATLLLVFIFTTLHPALKAPGDGFGSNIATEARAISQTPKDQENKIWTRFDDKGLGHVYIPKPEKYGLPPGLPSEDGQERKKYGLSWAHQLRCLKMIRDQYLGSQHTGIEQVSRKDSEAWLKVRRMQQIDGCFDYLRQNIECISDMTVEWPNSHSDELGHFQIDGIGLKHQCRKQESVLAYSADHRDLDTTTFLD